jgi:hypothetical protein
MKTYYFLLTNGALIAHTGTEPTDFSDIRLNGGTITIHGISHETTDRIVIQPSSVAAQWTKTA